MLKNIDLNGVGDTDEFRKSVDAISLAIQNAQRAKKGLPPLRGDWTDDIRDNWKTWVVYGALGYAGYNLLHDYLKRK